MQVDDTIRTDSTFTFCAVEDDADEEPEPVAAPVDVPEVEPVALDVVGLLLDSKRPRISTSWFTCWRNSLLSPSRMYVEPLVPVIEPPERDVPAELVPAVLPVDPGVELELDPVRALVRTNALPAELGLDVDDPAVEAVPLPEVPTAPPIWLPCCKQPVIMIVSVLLLRLD